MKGDVVVIPIPCSDLSGAKRRPPFVVKELEGDDVILCQITSQSRKDRYSIRISREDFSQGGLKITSYAKPNRLLTADRNLILYRIGVIKPEKVEKIIARIVEIMTT